VRSALQAAALALSLLASLPAHAVQPDEMLADPAMEARARGLSAELRCMVCQNQSIDDSDAELARDLRILLRERIAAGDTNEQVMDFLVARYGEFILLRPRFNPHTLILWLAPPLVLIAGAGIAFAAIRSRRRLEPAKALTPEEETRLRELARNRD
jgi:cytochrome c-type biogenesis protein CcmH